MTSPTADQSFMARALALAVQGEGHVEPNPMVGAVVVRDGNVVGEGWHQEYGAAHAEVNALRDAGEQAAGATLYVTLEPCCHTGKTPPCTESIKAAGITRLVASISDPFPAVDGGGFADLRAAGIECEVGVMETEGRALIAPFTKLTTTGWPWVIAKWAMTLDGKIATSSGSSKWITSRESREVVHQLRGRVDAILVGAGTARADDPLLTARPPGPRTALRIVLGSVPDGCQLLSTLADAPLLVALPPQAKTDAKRLRAAGAEVLQLKSLEYVAGCRELLDELGRRRLTNLLVEGGSQVLGSLFDLGAVDEVHAFMAPKIVGGSDALTPVAGSGIDQMSDALEIDASTAELLGPDVYLHGRLAKR